MVYLLTDANEYRQLPCPGVVTIGRDIDNTIRPESRSVSNHHAKISIDFIPGTNKLSMILEDLGSRNGTLVGEHTLDMERVKGPRKLQFGDYIKFGLTEYFFRIVEYMPAPDPDSEEELQISPVHSYQHGERGGGELPPIGPTIDFKTLLENSKIPSAKQPLRLPDINEMSQSNKYPGAAPVVEGKDGSMDFANLLSQAEAQGGSKSKSVTFNAVHTEAAPPQAAVNQGQAPATEAKSESSDKKFAQLGSFQKYFFPSYSREYLAKYLKVNELWLSQLEDRIALTQRTKSFYAKFVENLMQVDSLAALLPEPRPDQPPEEGKASKKSAKRTTKEVGCLRQLRVEEEEIGLVSQVFQALPADQREFVVSEFMAENLLLSSQAHGQAEDSSSAQGTMSLFGETLASLFELVKLCQLGAQQLQDNGNSNNPSDNNPSNPEIDYLLNQELIHLMRSAAKNLQTISQSTVLQCLLEAEDPASAPIPSGPDDAEPSASPMQEPLLTAPPAQLAFLAGKLETLAKFSSFYFLSPANQQTLSNEQVFELMIVYLSVLLVLLYRLYFLLLVLCLEMNAMYQKHLETSGQQQEETGLLAELQRLTMLSYSGGLAGGGGAGGSQDLKTIVDKLRKHEIDLAGKKYSGIYRLMQIFLKFLLKQVFSRWKQRTKSQKHYEITVLENEERLVAQQRRALFAHWRGRYERRRNCRRRISRFLRTLRSHHNDEKRTAFQRWKAQTLSANRLHPLVSELRLQVLSLQSELELLQSINADASPRALPPPATATGNNFSAEDGAAANNGPSLSASLLAAERALNKELLSTNIQLRDSLKELEFKLLEANNVSAAKRNDLVFHFLLDKENQLLQQRSEAKLLQAELEQLRNILAVQQRHQQPAPPAQQQPQGLPPAQSQQPSGLTFRYLPQPQSHAQAQPVLPPQGPGYYRGPAHQLPNYATGGQQQSMGKVEAKHIILNEVRRLKESLQRHQAERKELVQQRSEESERFLQLSLANQSLAHRLNEFNRSALALRELLRQKVGQDGLLELVESMLTMGVESYPLLGTVPNPAKPPADEVVNPSTAPITFTLPAHAPAAPQMFQNSLRPPANQNDPAAVLSGGAASKKKGKAPKKEPPSEYQKALEDAFLK